MSQKTFFDPTAFPDVIAAKVQLLDLSLNIISGPLPSSIGNWTSLKSLLLGQNSINGTLPSTLGATSITKLDLSYNSISEPTASVIRALQQLRSLKLTATRLPGDAQLLEAVASLPYLTEAYLGNCSIGGAIPPSFGSNLSTLQTLYLNGNNLIGTIPASFGKMTNLQILDMRGNNLTGSIPLIISSFSTLQQLLLSSNNLSGCFDQPLSINNAALCQLDMTICGCDRGGCGLPACPPAFTSCVGAAPFPESVCYNGVWIVPNSVIIQGKNVSITSPTLISGDLVILNGSSTVSITPTDPTRPLLTIDGCVTFKCVLEIKLTSSALSNGVQNISLLSYGDYCNGNATQFSSYQVNTDCGTVTSSRLDYSSRSLSLVFDGYDPSACSAAAGGLTPATIGIIIGCTLGGVLIIVIIVVILAVKVEAVGNKLMPWRARRKLGGLEREEL
jgi:hypothetical protein